MKFPGLAAFFLLAFAPLTTVAQRTFVCQSNTRCRDGILKQSTRTQRADTETSSTT